MNKYFCVVAYYDSNDDNNLRQSFHSGKTREDALRDFFDNHVGEKGANVLWLDLSGVNTDQSD